MKRFLLASTLMALAFTLSLAAVQPSVADDAKSEEKLLKPDKGVGTKYGARDPRKCESTRPPETGAPSAAQARAYLISGHEHETGNDTFATLKLLEDVKLEIGKGRPYDHPEGGNDIDTRELVYPVRGSYTAWTCYPISSAHPAGKSAQKTENPNASGICYKTTFGDWKVLMSDITTRKVFSEYFPAPK